MLNINLYMHTYSVKSEILLDTSPCYVAKIMESLIMNSVRSSQSPQSGYKKSKVPFKHHTVAQKMCTLLVESAANFTLVVSDVVTDKER